MARPSADREPPIVVGTNSGVSVSSGSRSFGSTAATLFRIDSLARASAGSPNCAHDARAEHERLNLFAVEHQRRQVIAGAEAIADARFAVDRRAGQDQIADVAVDRPLRNLQLAPRCAPRS